MGIALEVMPDDGTPQVGITISGAAAATISVEWTVDDGYTWTTVRGLDRVAVDGSAFVRHHTAPLNAAATYRLVVHAGTVTDPLEATITVASATAWIQDPLNPRAAVAISLDSRLDGGGNMLAYGSLMAATYEQKVDLVTPLGSAHPVASVGQMMLAGDIPINITHDVAAEGGELRRLLLSSSGLVIRGLPDGLLEPVAHVVATGVSERRSAPGRVGQISTFDLRVKQVAPPSLWVVVPWWTYSQVAALWAGSTYADVYAARPGDTYLEWLRNPEQP